MLKTFIRKHTLTQQRFFVYVCYILCVEIMRCVEIIEIQNINDGHKDKQTDRHRQMGGQTDRQMQTYSNNIL